MALKELVAPLPEFKPLLVDVDGYQSLPEANNRLPHLLVDPTKRNVTVDERRFQFENSATWAIFLELAQHAGEVVVKRDLNFTAISSGAKEFLPKTMYKLTKRFGLDTQDFNLITRVDVIDPLTKKAKPGYRLNATCAFVGEVSDFHAGSITIPDWFVALYESKRELTFKYIYYKVGNHELAEDLTEQVFEKAIRGLHSYQDQGQPGAWIRGIAHNLLIDHYRSRQEEENIDDVVVFDRNINHNPADAAVRRVENEALKKALLRLPSHYRSAVILKYLEGKDGSEIAAMLEISEAKARVDISRGLGQLQALLTGMQGIDPYVIDDERSAEGLANRNMTYGDIANVLGLNVLTVSSMISHAESNGELVLFSRGKEGRKRREFNSSDVEKIVEFRKAMVAAFSASKEATGEEMVEIG